MSEYQEKKFTVRVTKHGHKLPKEAVESPSEILKRHGSGQRSLDGPACAVGLDKMTSRCPFQCQLFHDTVILYKTCSL